MIEGETGLTPPESLVREMQRITDGNPLYVVEMARMLVPHRRLEGEAVDLPARWGLGVPASIRMAIGKRLATLTDECNAVLRAAAVLGMKFTIELLQRLRNR